MTPEDTIYSLNVEDMQSVADQVFGRELSKSELEILKSKLGDYIPWFDCTTTAIDDLIMK